MTRPWSPSAAREAVRAEIAQMVRADCPMVAAALREMPDEAFESPRAFIRWLRDEELQSPALTELAEAAS